MTNLECGISNKHLFFLGDDSLVVRVKNDLTLDTLGKLPTKLYYALSNNSLSIIQTDSVCLVLGKNNQIAFLYFKLDKINKRFNLFETGLPAGRVGLLAVYNGHPVMLASGTYRYIKYAWQLILIQVPKALKYQA
jgi:hypothetical protein